MNYTLDIEGYIGNWYNSKSTIKEILAKHKNKSVSVRMSSLGGDLNHGLDISAQFEEHGNVTVDIVSFNASSATVIALGAKKVRMHADAFYLIHKVMSWVNNWGYMNEDKIQEVIAQLEKEKKENEKVTLQLARKYSNRTGKSVVEILNLMKEETWLNAEEALEWGFIDEIYGSATEKINFAGMEGKFNALGLPISDRFRNKEQKPESRFDQFTEKVNKQIDDIRDMIYNLGGNKEDKTNDNKNPKIVMKKDWTHINAILEVEGVETADGKVNLAESELEKLNAALEKANKASEDAETAKTEAEKKLAEKETEFANYKNAAGDKTEPTKKDTDNGGGDKKNDSMLSVAARAREMYQNCQ